MSIHVWPGVADPALAGLSLAGLDVLTLVRRAPTRETGFDLATVRACADDLVVLKPEGVGEALASLTTIRAAMRPSAFVFADPKPAFVDEVAALAAYRLAVAKTVLPKRYGKPFVTPVAPTIAQLFDEKPSEEAVRLAARLATAMLVFRLAGEWGLAPTVIAESGAAITDRIAASGLPIVHARTQRELPMW